MFRVRVYDICVLFVLARCLRFARASGFELFFFLFLCACV